MAYIGNTPEVSFYTLGVEKFSGTGACTQFTLGRTISDANTITVVVNGVLQTPVDSYGVTAGLLTFTEAPDAVANNIVITYLATNVNTQYIPGQFAPDSVTQTALATGAVSTVKIVDDAITTPKVADNSITTIKIANNSITSEKISTPADIFDDAFLFGGM
jgi:hypothetical protein